MGFFNRLFGKHITEKDESCTTIPVSKIKADIVPQGAEIICESEIPASCGIGNLVYEKRYREAIDEGLRLLESSPHDAGVHINLMEAYFKGRELSPDYFDKSTYHAKMAILCGHHTGYAEERLAKNLDKCKSYHQSLQLYKLILDTEGFHFSSHGCGDKAEFEKRRQSVLAKIAKASDTESDILFSDDEIAGIIKGIKDNDIREKKEQERFDRIMKQMEEALQKDDFRSYDRLSEELHRPLRG